MTKVTLIVLTAGFLAELLLYWPFWRWRRSGSVVAGAALITGTTLLAANQPTTSSYIFALFSIYRLVNLRRLFVGRIQIDYLYRSSKKASIYLVLLQLAALALLGLSNKYALDTRWWIYLLASLQLIVAVILGCTSLLNLRASKLRPAPPIPEKDLPTLTVAIPARDETTELEECLTSLIASNYPKLEILVLDDCSQDKRTPEIIRQFAQSGVIFIQGEEPPGHWLAKNYAYQRLADEANGELILFCGTDLRFSPGSLRGIVETMLAGKQQMICAVPKNTSPRSLSLAEILLQPNRYAWELVLPRKILGRPAVLSTCWMIRAETLRQYGTFEAVSRKIIPETYFARQAAKQNRYSFLRSNDVIGITSGKTFEEQRETSVRTRYPQLHKRVELVALFGLTEVFVRLWPLAVVIMAVMAHDSALAAIALAGSMIVVGLHSVFITITYQKFLLKSLWVSPLAALYDITILNYSMWQYEFGTVYWKGRNITAPVMRSPTRQPSNSE